MRETKYQGHSLLEVSNLKMYFPIYKGVFPLKNQAKI